jgi:hypothetical protein
MVSCVLRGFTCIINRTERRCPDETFRIPGIRAESILAVECEYIAMAFAVGDRIKIRRSWSELHGALGAIAEPPDDVRKQSGYGSMHYREETTLTGSRKIVYWVQLDAGVAGVAKEAGEYDESELEKL